MKDLMLGDLVKSTRGRDAGAILFVVGFDGNKALLANGKERSVYRPKRKNTKHLKYTASPDGQVPEKLKNGEIISNGEMRKAIAAVVADYGVCSHVNPKEGSLYAKGRCY